MKSKRPTFNFKTMARSDVPGSRSGKHKKIVISILDDLDHLQEDVALKVPLVELDDSKEQVRSALSRAARKSNRKLATATDENFLYVWNVAKPKGSD